MVDNSSRRERTSQLNRNDMIKAAEKVFYEKGFERSTMDEFARESNFTKRTLYKHFSNKDELLIAVLSKGLGRLLVFLKSEMNNTNNGREKIHSAIFAFYNFYKENKQLFLLMDHVSQIDTETNQISIEFISLKKQLIGEFLKAIKAGQINGSIHQDLDASQIAHSITFVLLGFFNELSAAGDLFFLHFELDRDQFVNETLNMLISSFINTKENI
jgi:AcrR family transcriptional regulator